MKRGILSSMLAAALVLVTAAAVSADDETVVTATWSGSGAVAGVVTADDDTTVTWGAVGTSIEGSFDCTDSNNNPYSYGVDTVTSYMVSSVSDGTLGDPADGTGAASFCQVDRTDAKESSYGPAGQMTYTYVFADEGSAEFAMGTTNNFAAMKDCTWNKPKTAGGKNFEANAASFILRQWVGNGANAGDGYAPIITPTNNWASFEAQGAGTAVIDCMSCEAKESNARLGWGCGCFTNADAVLNGTGQFSVNAVGSNSIDSPSGGGGWSVPGDGTFGSCSLSIVATYAGNFTVSDYSMNVT